MSLTIIVRENATPIRSVPDKECPSWVEDTATYLYSISSSDEWAILVERWLQMEVTLGYPEGKVSRHVHYIEGIILILNRGNHSKLPHKTAQQLLQSG